MSFHSVNPHDGSEVFSRNFMTQDEVKALIERLDKAYKARLTTEGCDRARLKGNLENLHKIMTERRQTLAEILTQEIGKPITQALQEVDKAIKHTKWYIDHYEEVTKSREIPTEGAKKAGYHIDPLGIIFIIFPFNFPFSTPFRVLIPTLVAGNGIVIRPAGITGKVGQAMSQLFQDAGLDHADVVFSNHDDTEFIISHPAIQGFHFTGSTGAGKNLAAICGKNLKRTVMELGGNDAFIVLPDADIDFAVEKSIHSRIRNCGQVCTSAKRIILPESLYETFAAKLKAKVEAMKWGNPAEKDTEIGPLCKAGAAKQVWEQIQKTIASGDTVIFGAEEPKGAYLKPTAVKVGRP